MTFECPSWRARPSVEKEISVNNAPKQRTPEEELLLSRITAGVFIVLAIPIVAIVLGMSARIFFYIVAGS